MRNVAKLFVAGWKETSLVDVLGHVSFTLWLSFCNFRCPWCSNAKLARGMIRRAVNASELVEVIEDASPFVDYFHVTGGEPTLQFRQLTGLYRSVREKTGLLLSIDTNASIPLALRFIIEKVGLDHVAIDVKAPLSDPALYATTVGHPLSMGARIVEQVVESIRIAASKINFLELRTTMVPGLIGKNEVERIASDLAKLKIEGPERLVYVVQQFIPYETILDPKYRSAKRTPPELVKKAARRAKDILGVEVYYRTLEEGTVKV